MNHGSTDIQSGQHRSAKKDDLARGDKLAVNTEGRRETYTRELYFQTLLQQTVSKDIDLLHSTHRQVFPEVQYVLITLNNRLDTAAAAIVHRMMTRSRPRVFLLVSPFKRGSIGREAITANEEKEESQWYVKRGYGWPGLGAEGERWEYMNARAPQGGLYVLARRRKPCQQVVREALRTQGLPPACSPHNAIDNSLDQRHL